MSRDRRNLASGAPWEESFGYSRAVRVGRAIHVAGTTAVGENGEIVGPGDPYAQTVRILRIIRQSLQDLGADVEDVVRTRIYVTDIDHWQAIGKAHSEVFSEIRPACSLVEVRRLIAPDVLVEIEAEALLS